MQFGVDLYLRHESQPACIERNNLQTTQIP